MHLAQMHLALSRYVSKTGCVPSQDRKRKGKLGRAERFDLSQFLRVLLICSGLGCSRFTHIEHGCCIWNRPLTSICVLSTNDSPSQDSALLVKSEIV